MKKKRTISLRISRTTLSNLSTVQQQQVKGGTHQGCGSVSNWLECPPPTEYTCDISWCHPCDTVYCTEDCY
jgi:hypothetical protein